MVQASFNLAPGRTWAEAQANAPTMERPQSKLGCSRAETRGCRDTGGGRADMKSTCSPNPEAKA